MLKHTATCFLRSVYARPEGLGPSASIPAPVEPSGAPAPRLRVHAVTPAHAREYGHAHLGCRDFPLRENHFRPRVLSLPELAFGYRAR